MKDTGQPWERRYGGAFSGDASRLTDEVTICPKYTFLYGA